MTKFLDEMTKTFLARLDKQVLKFHKARGRVKPHTNKFKKLRAFAKQTGSANNIPLETVYQYAKKIKMRSVPVLDEENKTYKMENHPYEVYRRVLGNCFRNAYQVLKRSKWSRL